ncbi:MAG TPA: ABC transporter permease, partial [Jatrophihabitans sp.]|nr:ABC transporter permease [Jatrophihabitans sp.]
VYRRVTPAAPNAWRLLLLPIGLGELAYFVFSGRPATTAGQILAYLSGILMTMAGLVIAGPWLTMAGSRLLARRAHRPPALIAARRLADDPKAGFRAVSGLVLALFVTSTAIGVITTITAYDGGSRSTAAEQSTLIQDFRRFASSPDSALSVRSVPSALLGELRAIPGVAAVVLIHDDPAITAPFPPGVVSCADLARVPALGRCASGARTAVIEPELAGSKLAPTAWQAAPLAPGQLSNLPVQVFAVATDGSAAALERARTIVEDAYPNAVAPFTVAEDQADRVVLADAYQRLANVVIIASLPIAGCTLAVSVVAGLNERRRPFSLLRLTGAPLRTLRRVVMLESGVPLLVAATVSTAAGFLAAYLFLRSQLSETLQPPSLAFYGIVAAGLAASLAIIASTLPVLRRISGPEAARND